MSGADLSRDFARYVCQTSATPLGLVVSRAEGSSLWTADGREIWFGSSRTGFKDEAAMFDVSPQPYAQVFLVDRNGGNVRQLTDSKWEDSLATYVKVP